VLRRFNGEMVGTARLPNVHETSAGG